MERIKKIEGIFERIEKKVDFEEMEDKNVDIVFMMLEKENEGEDNMKEMQRIESLMREKDMVEKLRGKNEEKEIY